MEVQFGPNSVDEPNLLYKLQCKIKVFNTIETLPNRGYHLVASSSKYGLVFVAVPSGTLSVYYLNQLIDKECERQHMTVNLPEKPTHIAISCDSELLAVTGGQILCIYKVTDFQNSNVAPSLSVKCEVNPSTYVSAMLWNPCIDSIALAFYDGTLMACQASTGEVKKVPSKVRCICWSPKGKQLVTGNSDGTLLQYKPDLTAAKAIPAPNLFNGSPVEALAVYWIATYQFAVVYKNAADNSRPSVTIVNTPKGGQISCLNYEDICYSMGSNRPWYYYLQAIAQWNIILAASSNSMELATIGSADGANWMQWCQLDEARPELPLTDKKQENYPVGVCIDTCAIHQLPWGENETLPHMPLLHVVSQTGLLTIFNVINLNKEAAKICSPPQQITLPVHAMTSQIPGESPKPPEPTPAPVAKVEVPVPKQAAPAMPAASLFSAPVAAPIKIPSYTPQQTAAPPQVPKQKPAEVSAPPQTPTFPFQPTPQATPEPPKPQPTQTPENAALQAEQDKINKAKANQELKNMLVKEVNDFQNELYNFMLKTREAQARIQRDIESINSNFNFNSLDTEQLKKECSIDELRSAIVQLKLELVRACAVIAEARTHSDAREFHQWTQVDPLTTKRVSQVKKLAYYVQTQLDQAQKALDYKWSEASRENEFSKMPGKRMIRPILDDVYQPLVKQQEILSRQQAVLRTLRKTLDECDIGPVFKSSSLLRSTPFRNKDPLSKLTKNILNMSIEPKNEKAMNFLSPQKLEALRDALSNHKTTKIKPINIELRQHIITMKENYEKAVKEKIAQAHAAAMMKKEQIAQTQPPKYKHAAPIHQHVKAESKVEPKYEHFKQEPIKQTMSAPAFASSGNQMPSSGFANVARTLFTDEPKHDMSNYTQQQKQELPNYTQQVAQKPMSFAPQPPASPTTKSVLKDLLQTKSQANLDAKNGSNNIFMGQKICSPTAISRSSAPTPASQPSIFTSKPISEMSNIFNKLPTPIFDAKLTTKAQSNETGEPENEPPKPNKPMVNLFGMKPVAASTPVPDLVKTSQAKADIFSDKSKENISKTDDVPKASEKKEVKPLGVQMTNKSFAFATPENNFGPNVQQPYESVAVNKSTEPNNVKTDKVATTEEAPYITNADSKLSAFTTPSSSTKEMSPPQTEVDNLAKPKAPVLTQIDVTPDKVVTISAVPVTNDSSVPTSIVTSTSDSANISETKIPTTSASVYTGTPLLSGATVGDLPPTQVQSILKVTPTTISAPSSESTTTEKSSEETVRKTDPPVSSAASVFASAAASTITTSSGFAPTPSSVFGQASGATSTTSSLFATTTASFGQSVFGAKTQASVFETNTSAASVFGTAASQAFGNTTTTQSGSIFGSPTTQASVFGSATQTTQASIFGSPTQTTQASLFGSATQTTQASVFGTQTTQASLFGTPTSTTQSSIFGSPTQTTQASLFGTPTQTTQASVFGVQTQTTQASVFGTPTQTTQASVFGTPTQTTQASVFGSPTQTTQASVFGSPTQTTQASVFGSPTQTTQASVFGTPTQTTQASVFGTPTQTTQASVFGSPTQTTQASVFGAPAANSGSLFGGAESNLFASASISTTSAPTQATSGGNIFGGSTSGSVFGGSGGNVFGGKAFGQPNSTAASIFGGAASFAKPATNLWAGGNSGSGFGSTGFGQPTTQASSIFGGGTGGSFSAVSGGAFGSAQQTPGFGTGESQPTSVFGSPQQQTAPGGFGGSPVFGSKPAFGQPASFGSPTTSGGFGGFGGFNKSPGFGAPAAFGSTATFGGTAFGSTSPGKVFGGAAASFGSPTQQSNSTFENLATQNTLTFGNLAQQSPQQQQQQQPTFNTSPSFTGWRG